MSKKSEYESIMAEIRAGLTGRAERDVPYLMEQMDRYEGHPLVKEITRECGRMIYETVPEDLKKKLD